MLNKETCKWCEHRAALFCDDGREVPFEEWWKEMKGVPCFLHLRDRHSTTTLVSRDGPPTRKCPHRREHMVSQDAE